MDVMLDIETFSSRNNAAVASIGACAFDPNRNYSLVQEIEQRFYVNVDLRDQRGRDFDGDTVYWWLKQSDRARQSLDRAVVSVQSALLDFRAWYKSIKGGRAWAYGATFDHVILQDLYNSRYEQNPIHYRNQLCMRTVVKLAGIDSPVLPDVQHNALDDALAQTVWITRCLKNLKIVLPA